MLPVRRYRVTAHTLLAGRLAEVRSVDVPATGVMRAIWAVTSIHRDHRPLVYRARAI